jgi:hypothetical protein
MYDDSDRSELKIKIILASIIVLFVSVIVAISAIFNFDSTGQTTIVNNSNAKNAFSSDVVDTISRTAYSFLKENGYSVSESEIVIRDSFNTEYDEYYLIDVDSIKQTYRFYYDGDSSGRIGCPDISETKYPDSFCIAKSRENDDTATMILEDILPYDSSIGSDISFRIYRKDLDHNLYIHIFACESDAVRTNVESSVKQLIKSRGANPDVFPLVYEFNGCSN